MAYQGRGTALKDMMMLMVVVVGGLLWASTAVLATNYKVGDASGWTIMTYDSWLAGKTFKEGDTLEFVYTRTHDVVEVSEAEYGSCSKGSNTVYTNGDTTYNLTSAGSKYYICTVSDHCANGMKLAVNVVAATATTPTSSPTPTTTPSTTPSNTSTTTTPSSSGSFPLSQLPSIFTLFLTLGLTSFFFHSS